MHLEAYSGREELANDQLKSKKKGKKSGGKGEHFVKISKSFQICDISDICMVLILDVNSEIGAHARRNLCYLICLRHLLR